jgi:DNA-binding MarR family transcriptional regulator
VREYNANILDIKCLLDVESAHLERERIESSMIAKSKPKSRLSVDCSKPTDLEFRLIEKDHHSTKLWLRLLTCSGLIETRIRTALREEFDTTLPRFDFLAQLERVPNGLSMGELSKRMMVSGGNTSGIAAQLVKEGLVDRRPEPDNRRTFIVKLTPKGKRLFAKMAVRHEQWVITLLGQLSEKEVGNLMRLLGRVKGMASTAADF